MKLFKLISLCSLFIWLQTATANTYTVLNPNDSGTNSLRWAIDQANANSGPDAIQFNIGGGGMHTIMLNTPLPALTDTASVLIDGLSQPGAFAGTAPPQPPAR